MTIASATAVDVNLIGHGGVFLLTPGHFRSRYGQSWVSQEGSGTLSAAASDTTADRQARTRLSNDRSVT